MRLEADRPEERIDVFLARRLELSRSAAQHLLAQGLVTVDGKPAAKNRRLVPGERVEATVPPTQEVALEPEQIPLNIVYEDGDVIVVDKPKGMVVHPAAGHWSGTLVHALMYHFRDSLSGINGELRPGIVHRIDKDTSGLLIAAKNDFAHRALAAQLAGHTMFRQYECIVCGGVRDDAGTIDAPIGRHPANRKKMAVTAKNSKPAITHFEVVERFPGYTHLRCRLETGRTHQIRVHLAWRSHPILGDTVYGHPKKELGLDTQCLHAGRLTFVHPRTGEQMTLTCPLPPYFEEILEKLRRQNKK